MRPIRALAATGVLALAGALLPAVTSYAAGVTGAAAAPARGPAVRGPAARHQRSGRLVVGYHSGATAPQRAAALARVGARVQAELPRRRAAVVTTRGALGTAAAALLRDPAVRFVEPEGTFRAYADATGPERAEIGVDAALAFDNTLTGAGIEVAVIDTAVHATNPDLTGRVVVPVDTDKSTPLDPDDPDDLTCVGRATTFDCAHGTAVAGIVAAAADGNNMVGIAPGATIVSYNVFRTNGYASSTAIANAIDAATARSLSQPLRVINMSLGGPFDSQLIREAIADARAAGIVVVAAAGNDGGERANFPAGDPFVLSVGASESMAGLWKVSGFSSRGDVDVLAPGVGVKVWYPADESSAPAVTTGNGTSFAAPMVSGIAAILAAKGFTGDVARAAIVASAESRHGDSPYPAASGAGRADVLKAFQLANGATAPYTAVFVDRGGQVANVVGRRDVEVLRVDPDETVPNTHASLSASHGSFGTVVNATASIQSASALMRTTAKYAVPGGTVVGNGTLTANGGAGGDDTITTGLRFLDPNNGPEGTNSYSNQGAFVNLAYGSRSSYIRSMGLHNNATLTWDFEYAESSYFSTIFVWMPATANGVADALGEPWDFQEFEVAKGTGELKVQPGFGDKPGRWKIGWVTFSELDNGRYYFRPHFAEPKISLTAPALVSSSGTGLPFRVSWTRTTPFNAKYDVQWTTRVKSGNTWVTKPWSTWYSQTTLKTAVFGGGNQPATVVPGVTYYVRARAVDDLGNASGWTTKAVVDPLNDNTRGTNWYGAWAVGHSSSRWLGDVHHTNSGGARLVVVADGTQFQVVGDRCVTCGQFRVYVDGVYRALVDTRAGGLAVRQVLWNSGVLGSTIKQHRVEVVAVGTAGRPTVSIDAVGVTR